MAQSDKYITREEFEPVKNGLDRLSIRVEVITHDLHQLTNMVGDLAEAFDLRFDRLEARMDKLEDRMDRLEDRMDKLEQRFDKLEQRFDKLEQRFDKLEKTVVDGHAAILSAIMQLAPRAS